MAVRRTPRRTSGKRKLSNTGRKVSAKARRTGRKLSNKARKLSGRKRSPNVYFKFRAQYLREHPAVKALPVPEQGRVVGRAYRAKFGKASPSRKRSPSPKRSRSKSPRRSRTPARK